MAKNPTSTGKAQMPEQVSVPVSGAAAPVAKVPASEPGAKRGRGTDPLKLFIANRAIDARKRLRLTQVQLAERANITPGTVFLVEYARANPSLELLVQLAKALEIEIGDLFPSSALFSSRTARTVAREVQEQATRCQLILRQVITLTETLTKDEET